MLKAENIQFVRNPAFSLKDIQLNIKKGEVISLIGPNGSGKSTLLRVIANLLKPEQGHIIIDGQNLKTIAKKDFPKNLAMLPQMNDHMLDLTVGELVEFGRAPFQRGIGRLSVENQEIVEWALEVTGLTHMRNRLLPGLSGGERQRAWIAMAVAQRSKVLLLDEPTTYLDIAHQMEVLELVKYLNEEFGITIIMVLHDINQAATYSDRLIVMKAGQIRYDGIPQCVLCKEMFQTIFNIDAEVHNNHDGVYFTPLRRRRNG
ncbi:ABC transporter ATP-binding protein [Kurthia huakuii]|uniref:ABC transporter ATP-binding protein n=1 Tax=Kurthia huakuii TaxID=1421019 RepID=UPI00049649F7|nr:iron complex transport system ATP-binding protein [Kurthia huakuii]